VLDFMIMGEANRLSLNSVDISAGASSASMPTHITIRDLPSDNYTFQVLLGAVVLLSHSFTYCDTRLDDDERKLQKLREQKVQKRNQEQKLLDRVGKDCAKINTDLVRFRALATTCRQAEQEAVRASDSAAATLKSLDGLWHRRNQVAHPVHNNEAYRNMLHKKTSDVMLRHGVLGAVAQFGCVEDAGVARTIEQKLGAYLSEVLVKDDGANTWLFNAFREHNQDPANAASQIRTSSQAIALKGAVWYERRWKGPFKSGDQAALKLPEPPLTAALAVDPNCCGYAVNLISIPEPPGSLTIKELRAELWWPLLQDTIIFSTRELMEEFGRQYPCYNGDGSRRAIGRLSLDGGSLSADGRQAFCEPPSRVERMRGVDFDTLTPLDRRWETRKKAYSDVERYTAKAAAERAKKAQAEDSIQQSESLLVDKEAEASQHEKKVEQLETEIESLDAALKRLQDQQRQRPGSPSRSVSTRSTASGSGADDSRPKRQRTM